MTTERVSLVSSMRMYPALLYAETAILLTRLTDGELSSTIGMLGILTRQHGSAWLCRVFLNVGRRTRF